MKHFLKLSVAMSIIVAAASAQATIILASVGTWANSTTPGVYWTQSESVIPFASYTAPYAPLTTLSATIYTASPSGTLVYSDGGADSLTIAVEFLGFTYNGPGFGSEGDWQYVSGTGSYAGLTGFGTFTISQSLPAGVPGYYSQTNVVGELEAVPEPMPIAVMGLGVVGLLVRRRRTH